MASFSRKTGIIGALAIAGVLIVGSYIISAQNFSFFAPATASAASTQALLKEYAQKDSDNDGLPDWEESLYGLDPNNAHSFSPNMTDGQAVSEGLVKLKFTSSQLTASSTVDTSNLPSAPNAVPGSLTDEFSQNLLAQFVTTSQNSNGQPSDTDITTLAQNAIQTLVQNHALQNKYSLAQINVNGAGSDALVSYAGAVEAIFEAHTLNDSENEVDYFSDAVQKNDATALPKVAAIGSYYSALAPDLMQGQVPAEAQYAHLEMANSLARLGTDVTALASFV
jgi:hypothetical protein